VNPRREGRDRESVARQMTGFFPFSQRLLDIFTFPALSGFLYMLFLYLRFLQKSLKSKGKDGQTC
jgi:hypothetical protein